MRFSVKSVNSDCPDFGNNCWQLQTRGALSVSNAFSSPLLFFSSLLRYRQSWSAGYGHGRPRLIWAPVKSVRSLLLRSWCMRLLIHRLTSATATSRLCEHTWRLQVNNMLKTSRASRSALESGRRSHERKQVPVQHSSRSCWKHRSCRFVKLQPDVRVCDTASVWRLDLIEDQLIMKVACSWGWLFLANGWLTFEKSDCISIWFWYANENDYKMLRIFIYILIAS